MLTIAKVETNGARYYLSTTAIGADHPGGLVEPDGVWLGRQARALGLVGSADPGAVRALFAGRSPVDGRRLLPEASRRRLSAYDCTFSTPKSVSVLFALGKPEVTEQVRAAHIGAVQGALDYLERHGVCVRDGQVDGRTRLTRAEAGVVAVGWLHRSSRAPDPHLHTHVLIANLVRHPAGRWQPLDARDIYHELRTAAALFETHLRGELTARLGLGWGELNGVWADVEGADPRVLRAFSQRSVQIAADLEQSGLEGPKAARLVADVTRPQKDVSVPYTELVERWRRRGHEEGLAASHLSEMLGRGNRSTETQMDWAAATLAAAASRSVDGSFTRRDLIQARCAAAPAGLPAAAVERDVDELLAGQRLFSRQRAAGGHTLRLKSGGPPPSLPEIRYCTAQLAESERRLVAAFAERAHEVTVIAYPPRDRHRALDELSKALAAWASDHREVAAIAPGWRAATSFEAATGIETIATRAFLAPTSSAASAAFAGARSPMPDVRSGVLVLADAHCFSGGVLEQALRHCRAGSAQLVLVGPARELAERELLDGVLRVAKGRLPDVLSRGALRPPPEVTLQRSLGAVGAVVTTSLRAAMSEAVRQLRHAPPASVLVAADHGLVRQLREEAAASGASSLVVHSNDLDAVLRRESLPSVGRTGGLRVVAIGGASALHTRADRLDALDRRHVLVIPSASLSSSSLEAAEHDVVGRVAEACRPRYLTAELGSPRRARSERAAWRSSAAMIERFRERWGVTDDRHALGAPSVACPDRDAFERERERVRDELHGRRLARELGPPRLRGPELGR